ncbi:recBCD nuclease inihibitor [Staphylococcus phage MVC_VPHSA1]|uniref:RecBCD nuclease inihibitor n=1 Tax=Staphylococcus phage MVC_VPHSA1 TaxID=3088876 RepID=A0ABZ0QZN4_9CAUD|nr:recBCD nuclease inihibitor [Staphylococcus phage MVC_VPHSA1]
MSKINVAYASETNGDFDGAVDNLVEFLNSYLGADLLEEAKSKIERIVKHADSSIHEQIDELRSEHEEEIDEMCDEVDNLNSEVDDLKQDLAEANERIKELEDELNDYE